MKEMTGHLVIWEKPYDMSFQFLKLDQKLVNIDITTSQHVREQQTFTQRHVRESQLTTGDSNSFNTNKNLKPEMHTSTQTNPVYFVMIKHGSHLHLNLWTEENQWSRNHYASTVLKHIESMIFLRRGTAKCVGNDTILSCNGSRETTLVNNIREIIPSSATLHAS